MAKFQPHSDLTNWIECAKKAATIIANKFGIEVEKIDMQSALMAVLKVEHSTDLLSHDWSVDKMLDLTQGIDFKSWSEYENVVLRETVLPSTVPGRLDEETIKVKGEIWRIHLYDPDPFPFLPHAHNVQSGLRLDLRNGNLYRKHELVGRLPQRDLERLRGMVRRIDLPPVTV